MKNTNTKAFRQTVYSYLCQSAYSFDETGLPDTQANRAQHMWDRFNQEYNYPQNRTRYPSTQQRVASWLSGLAINTAYTYCDIIALAETWHDCTLTDKERDKVCAQWFDFLAMKLLQLWQTHGIDPHK